VEAATIIPSTENGVSAATHPGCPCEATSICICRYETVAAINASSATQPGRCPPDPSIRAGHRWPSSANSAYRASNVVDAATVMPSTDSG
jgi:hypothetical protein